MAGPQYIFTDKIIRYSLGETLLTHTAVRFNTFDTAHDGN